MVRWIEAHKAWKADDLYVVMSVCGLALGILLLRKTQKLRREIAQRRRGEEALQRERDHTTAVLDTVDSLVAVLDAEARITRFNKACERTTGYAVREVLGKYVWEVFAPPGGSAEPQTSCPPWEEGVAGEFEAPLVTRSGEWRLVRWSNVTLPTADGALHFVCTGSDVTDRRRTEAALRASEKKYRSLFYHAEDAVTLYALTSDGLPDRFLEVNEAACRLFGRSRTELLGLTPLDLSAPEDVDAMSAVLADLASQGRVTFETTYVAGGGQRVPVEASAHLFELEGRRVVLSVARDLTARKAAEAALRESEERYRRLVEMSPEGIFVHTGGPIVFANDALCALLGASSPAEIIGRDVLEIVAAEHHERVRERVARMIELDGEVPRMEQRYTRLDGAQIDVEVASCAVPYEGRRAVLTFVRDITDRKRAEASLRQANAELSAWVSALERRERESAVLRETSELLQASTGADEAYAVVKSALSRLFPGSTGSLFVLRPSRDRLEAVVASGKLPEGASACPPTECWALRLGRPHEVAEGGGGAVCRHAWAHAAGPQWCVPLAAQGDVLGVLRLQADSAASDAAEGGSERTRDLLLTLADQVGLALANLRLRQTLRDQAIRDPLTGLFNRRYLEETIERELARATRKGTPLAVAMLDVDHFKRFNDLHGHDAGDAILREVGRYLQAHVRAEDIACRYGGEEFALIFPDISLEMASRRLDELREGIKRIEVVHRQRRLGPVTVSLGLAGFPQHGSTANSIFRAADLALYRAKAAGRDALFIAGQPAAPEQCGAAGDLAPAAPKGA